MHRVDPVPESTSPWAVHRRYEIAAVDALRRAAFGLGRLREPDYYYFDYRIDTGEGRWVPVEVRRRLLRPRSRDEDPNHPKLRGRLRTVARTLLVTGEKPRARWVGNGVDVAVWRGPEDDETLRAAVHRVVGDAMASAASATLPEAVVPAAR